MPRPLTDLLAALLAPGELRLGQIIIARAANGFQLCHQEDQGQPDLTLYRQASDARHISLYDDDGTYRPLKTAPNLRRGWRLLLPDVPAVHEALDLFYPAMLGVWRSHLAGRLVPVPLRATLDRQSGMYAITRKLTDEQAQAMIGDFCRSETGCLKRILWEIAPGLPVRTLSAEKFDPTKSGQEMPLLCHEACNLLVAKAREVVKSSRA